MRYLSVHKSFNFLIQRKSSFFRSRLDEGSLSTEHAAAESREKKSENEQNFPSSRALGRAKGMRCSFSRAASVHSQIHMKDFLQKKNENYVWKLYDERKMCATFCWGMFRSRSAADEERKCVYIFVDTSLGCFKNIYIFLPPVENICLHRRSKFFHTSRVYWPTATVITWSSWSPTVMWCERWWIMRAPKIRLKSKSTRGVQK